MLERAGDLAAILTNLQDRERQLRSDAGHAHQGLEQLPLVGSPETVERHRVLPDHQAGQQADVLPAAQPGEHRGGSVHEVPDPGDVHDGTSRRHLGDLPGE